MGVGIQADRLHAVRSSTAQQTHMAEAESSLSERYLAAVEENRRLLADALPETSSEPSCAAAETPRDGVLGSDAGATPSVGGMMANSGATPSQTRSSPYRGACEIDQV